MNKLLSVTILATVMLLAGCVRTVTVREPVEVPVTVYETIPVPEALLAPCTVELDLQTNADLERALAAALLELKRCTADKEAIRLLP